MEFLNRMRNVRSIFKYIDTVESRFMWFKYRQSRMLRLHRKPIRVLTNTSEPEDFKTQRINQQILSTPEVPSVREHLPAVSQKKGATSQKTPDLPEAPKSKSVTVPAYIKLPDADDRFIKILTTLKSRNQREKSGKILLEGVRLINDAIAAGVELKTLFFSREETLAQINLPNNPQLPLYRLLYKTMRVWSSVATCPGIMGVFKKPTTDQIATMTDPAVPVTILCDNIRDPGNMGSIIRSSAAAGCRAVLLSEGCVDPWEQKVLRTGMGAHFRVPIINNIPWENVLNYLPSSSTLYLADNSADIDPFDSDAMDVVDYLEEPDHSNTEERYVCQTEEGENILVDNTYLGETHLEKYENISLPCHLYSSVRFPEDDIVVYVGGETHGLSPRANKLALEFGGRRLKIPLENGVDSLNSSFALAIILYEIKRQLKETYVVQRIK